MNNEFFEHLTLFEQVKTICSKFKSEIQIENNKILVCGNRDCSKSFSG